MADNKAFNFTKGAIEALPTPEKREVFYFDTNQRNLCLSITPKRFVAFHVWRKVKGQKVRFKIGRFPELSVTEARTKCTAYLNRIENGEDVVGARREAREELTLKAFFAVYLQRHAKPHKKSWAYDAANFTNHLDGPLGNKLLSGISKARVVQLQAKLAEERGQVIANRVLALLVMLYNKAAEWGFTAKGFESPTRFVKKYRERSRERFLQGDELPVFFAALEADHNQTFKDYVWVSLLTGARKANVLAMTWHQVDLKRKEWRIPETKNGESLVLPLIDEAVELLERRKRTTSSIYVFSGSGASGHLADPKKPWQRLIQQAHLIAWAQEPLTAAVVERVRDANPTAGPLELTKLCREAAAEKLITLPEILGDLHIHDLRRTLGSWQTIAGASAFVVGRSLGHKSMKSTQVYARLNLDPVRASVQGAVKLMVGEKNA